MSKFFKKHPGLLHDKAPILKLVEDIEASKVYAIAKDVKKGLRVEDPTPERHLDTILELLIRKVYLMYLMKREGRCYRVVPPYNYISNILIGYKARLNGLNTSPKISKVTTPSKV